MSAARFIGVAIKDRNVFEGKFLEAAAYHRLRDKQWRLGQTTHTTHKTLDRAFVHRLGIPPKLCACNGCFNAAQSKLDSRPPDEYITSIVLDLAIYKCWLFIADFRAFSVLIPLGYLVKAE